MKEVTIQKFSCEQLYNLWVTDPDLIQIIDLRSAIDFQEGHIPGSLNIEVKKLPTFLSHLPNKLAVIIGDNIIPREIENEILAFTNFVFLNSCQKWKELKYPMTSKYLGEKIKIKEDAKMKDIIFHQLFEAESSTYTYIIADKKTKEAAIIDPVLETVDRDLKLIEELGLKLIYALDTHIHADHITGAGEIRRRLGIKTAVSQHAEIGCVDIALEEGQELSLGGHTIRVLETPGHTNTCLTYYFEGMIFTGDALLVRTCGRTDFQQGSPKKLFESVRNKLFQLPDETIIYPGHDYRGHTSSTIGEERKFNSRLRETISMDEFQKIMNELKLPNPKKIHEAVPANLACGQPQDKRLLHPQIVDGVPEVTPLVVLQNMPQVEAGKIQLIDVRRPDEFNNELGHVKGAQLVTLGPELTKYLERTDKNQEIVFICRSGGRSGSATIESQKLGFKKTINMAGGMIRWNDEHQPVERI